MWNVLEALGRGSLPHSDRSAPKCVLKVIELSDILLVYFYLVSELL